MGDKGHDTWQIPGETGAVTGKAPKECPSYVTA